MAKAEICSGNCGFVTYVEANMSGACCRISIRSDCKHIMDLSKSLKQVDPFEEVSFRNSGPLTLRLARRYVPHASCPVPVGVIKVVETAAGMALPRDITIKIT